MPDLPDTTATPVRPVTDPAGWHAGDLDNADGWVYRLTAADINKIDDAVRAIETAGIEIAEITETDFALPSLDARHREIGHKIVHGRGVALIKGVPVGRYTSRQAAAAYWGIGLRIGVPVSQNGKGHVLGHVKNLTGGDCETSTHRGYHTSADLPWHADSCDVVGLLCLQTSKSGGDSYIVSSVSIHNEIIVRRAMVPRSAGRDSRRQGSLVVVACVQLCQRKARDELAGKIHSGGAALRGTAAVHREANRSAEHDNRAGRGALLFNGVRARRHSNSPQSRGSAPPIVIGMLILSANMALRRRKRR